MLAGEPCSGRPRSAYVFLSSLTVFNPALSSGSLNMISVAITFAPAIARLSMALARIFRGQGKRPISSRSSSSITTISISGFLSSEALNRDRRSKVFFSIISVKSPMPVSTMKRNTRVRTRPITQSGIPFLRTMVSLNGIRFSQKAVSLRAGPFQSRLYWLTHQVW